MSTIFLADFIDFIPHRIIRIPVHSTSLSNPPFVIPYDLIGEDGCGGQCPDVFRRHHFPPIAEVILQECTQSRIDAVGVPLFLNGVEIGLPFLGEQDFQIALLALSQVNVEAVFWRRNDAHTQLRLSRIRRFPFNMPIHYSNWHVLVIRGIILRGLSFRPFSPSEVCHENHSSGR